MTSQEYTIRLALALDKAIHDAGNQAARDVAPVMDWLNARGLGLTALYSLEDEVRQPIEVSA